MSVNTASPWHKQSFDGFLKTRLPQLLADRLPLANYHVEDTGPYACRVTVAVTGKSGEVSVEYASVPRPDEGGVFELDGQRRVVLPVASSEDLDTADIRCAGEQLHEYIAQRLGEAPAGLPWDESLVRSFVPLEIWVRDFLLTFGQELDARNRLSILTHLRRIDVPTRKRLTTPSQFGRVCPYETPEGDNIGRILTVAVGATIQDGKLVIVDPRPEAGIGVTASMVPLLEHNDVNRQLLGVNMMRQWYVPPDPEPAYVQSGNEPDCPGSWCGRNLLTAFLSLGGDTYEDGIVISESAGRRLNYPHPIEPGDKLSNRHGTKGTVSRILPDREMPHLADGTPVELVFSFIGLHTRLNFGQVREALWGRIARAEGKAVVIPPFHAPSERELKERLKASALPESGMETLALGSGGRKLPRPSTVGWVYWGRVAHLALEKIHASVTPPRCNMQGVLEYLQLRDAGAFETIAETYNTRSVEREDAATLARRVAAGEVDQAGPPSPKIARLIRRLRVAGIQADLSTGGLRFGFALPEGPTLRLACPIPHPWLAERTIAEIGALESEPLYDAVVSANSRLLRLTESQAPQSLQESAAETLRGSVSELFDSLLSENEWGTESGLPPMNSRVLFSGRAVISPGPELRLDQLGLAEEIAWTLFGPLAARQLGGEKDVTSRTQRAARVLDEIMARSWIVLNRAPSVLPTSLLAFHPLRRQERVIRIHPLTCWLLNADFDGDQAGVFLPITQAGQREAGELLSVAGHLKRDPQVLRGLIPKHEALWGLASLSLSPEGRKRLAAAAGIEIETPQRVLTHDSLLKSMRTVLESKGVQQVLDTLENLMRLGFEAAAHSGASMSPFIGQTVPRPPAPSAAADEEAWENYAAQLAESIASRNDFDGDDLGPQVLSVKSGARGSLQHLGVLLGVPQTVTDAAGMPFRIVHGWCEGRTVEEILASVASHREGLGKTAIQCAEEGYQIRRSKAPRGFNVLARAMRTGHPGVVFARAAAIGEVDPLADLDSRAYVGLPMP